MCTPEIAAAAAVANTFIAVNSSRQQGRFAKSTAEYNARVAENQAQDVRNQANEAENIQRQKTAELLSKQRAQLGAANVELGMGSALQLQEDTRMLGEVDAMRIRSTGEAQVRALETGADLTRQQGAFAKIAGDNQALGAAFQGVGDFLDTGVADKWYNDDSAAVQQPVSYSNNVTGYPIRD